MMTAALQPKEEGQVAGLRRQVQLVSRLSGMLFTIGEGFVIAARHGALTRPNQPHHTKLYSIFAAGCAVCLVYKSKCMVRSPARMPCGSAIMCHGLISL